MAVGWSRDGAVNEQIDASLADAIEQARGHLHHGVSRERCIDCDVIIPVARRLALAGVTRCIACQTEEDAKQKYDPGYNRKGCKDSQLK